MKRSTLFTIAAVIAVVLLLFYMTTARASEECSVCVEFQGRSNCAAALGSTVAEATETAHRTACGPLVRGMNESIACDNRAPLSVQCKTR
ncbi:MAG TPA: hypothetical protein VK573_05900 [Gemmatimonadales bacterium]|nr:hypothetical protein [Gemmatimonadales bacterium]